MSDLSKAVFLSYASQDAAAARRICEALRSGGIEVWFDADGGLEHGDEWDAKIRKQIKECVLFIPVISANTQARHEGYFRIEWDLAAERARGIASGVAFILPVVIDDTREPEALVPDRFRMVQWTKLPGGVVTPEVQARYLKLWSHRTGALKHESDVARAFQPVSSSSENTGGEVRATTSRGIPAVAWMVIAAVAIAALLSFLALRPKSNAVAGTRPPTSEKAAPMSEAGRLVAKAWEQMDKTEMARNELLLAEGFCRQAAVLEEANPAVWAAWSAMNTWYYFHAFELLPARKEAARDYAQKALTLDSKSYDARYAWAHFMVRTATSPGEYAPALPILRELLTERPDEPRALYALGFGLMGDSANIDEGFATLERLAAKHPWFAGRALDEVGWTAFFHGRFALAESAADRAVKAQPYWNNLGLKATLALRLRGDVELAQAMVNRLPSTALQENWGISLAVIVADWRGDHERAVGIVQGVTRDWLENFFYPGSTSFLSGLMRLKAKQVTAAEKDFRRALEVIAVRLDKTPNDPALLYYKAEALRLLGMREEADKTHRQLSEVWPSTCTRLTFDPPGQALEYVRQMVQRGYTIDYFPPGWWFTVASLRLDPLFENVRQAPGFQALLDEVAQREKQQWSQTPAAAGAKTGATSLEKSAGPEKSLLVLPLENLSPDPENAFFTDGMHQEIITTLQRTTDLHVFGRDTALAFKRGSMTVAEFAQRVGAVNVITGSVRRVGIKARILVELRRARDDALLWSSPDAERELTDIWAVQSEIADQVARVLQAREAKGVIGTARFMTKNPQAYDLFLKEQAAFFTGLKPDQDAKFAEAIRIGKEAFQLDPSFMSVAQFIAVANAVLYVRTSNPAQRAIFATESKHWAEVASRLAPGGAGDVAMISHLYYIERDFLRAVTMAENGVRAMPNDSGFRNFLALAQVALGRTAEAAENFQKALTLDPLMPVLHYNLIGTLADLRRTEQAFAVIARLEALSAQGNSAGIAKYRFQLLGEIPSDLSGMDPVEWLWHGRHYDQLIAHLESRLAQEEQNNLGRFSHRLRLSDAWRQQGDLARATEAARSALALAEGRRSEQEPSITEMRVAECLVRLGRSDEALAIAQRAVEARSESGDLRARWSREVDLAAMCVLAGRKQQGIVLLGKLLRVPSGLTVPMLKVDPAWHNVRDDPAFKALLADPKNSAPL